MSSKRLTPLDMTGLQIINALLEVLASNPGTTVGGRVIYRSDLGLLGYYDGVGGAWRSVVHLGHKVTDLAAPTSAFAMNGQKITGLGLATVSTDAASLANKLTDFAAPTSALPLNGQKITGLADGTANTDAATWGQVQAAQAGLDAKPSVRVATTAAGTLASSFANGQTVDGITLATGDRILIKDQASAQENGIYVVAASGAPARASDMDAWTEVPGAFTFVELGTVNANTGWTSTADQGGTLNTTAIPWVKFSASASAGAQVATGLIGNGALTTIVFNHARGNQWVNVQVYEVATLAQVECDITLTDANNVTLAFAVAPASNALRVVVVG